MTTHPMHTHDYLVFIGRFQPFHMGHKVVVQTALARSDKVLILVGSPNIARSSRNPFTFEERKQLILDEFGGDRHRIVVEPIDDLMYNDQLWVTNVQRTVTKAILDNYNGNSKNVTLHGMSDMKIGLIGSSKDHTSYYLKLFPQWDSIDVPNYHDISATRIRNSYFSTEQDKYWEDSQITPPYSYHFLSMFMQTETYAELWGETEFVNKYKKAWENAPYAPTFVTVDAVVVQSGHILLVRRKAKPGQGQLALPGGFLDPTETILDSVIRELREETKIKVPDPVLRGSIVDVKVFDNPNRSTRGRTITHAHLIKLRDETTLPKVKGSDDAEHAMWVPLGEIEPTNMFEDHYFIIQNMVGEL